MNRLIIRLGIGLSIFLLGMHCSQAQVTTFHNDKLPEGGVRWEKDDLSVVLGLDANLYFYASRGSWWGMGSNTAPLYNSNRNWGELWLMPRLNLNYKIDNEQLIYGAVSVGATKDFGGNPFDYFNQGATRFENKYLGYKAGNPNSFHLDVSAGSQPFMLGTGMLIFAGAGNGNEWGNSASFKRQAWDQTAIANVGYKEVTIQGFYLKPNEVPSMATQTSLAGTSMEWKNAKDGRAGLAYIIVPQSNAMYPGQLAPLAFIQQGRQGLKVYHGWSELNGPLGLPQQLTIRGEFAIERNQITNLANQKQDMQAAAYYGGLSYWFQQTPWMPKLTYGYAYFSGNNPNSNTYGRFDPLYYGNGLDNWWFGANGAYAYINSNVQFNRLTLDMFPTAQDIVKLQFVNAQVVQIGSPIQFGQSATFDNGALVVGPQAKGLSNEYMAQYIRLISKSLAASSFFSVNTPGPAIKQMVPTGAKNWFSLGMGVSYAY
jgi:hypothetical protein